MTKLWIQTIGGRAVDLPPTPDQVDLHDIAHALSHVNRFCGHTPYPYNVARHSLMVSAIAIDLALDAGESQVDSRRIGLLALLHDAHEAYIGDIPAPVKWALQSDALKSLEALIDLAIDQKFGLDGVEYKTLGFAAYVKQADLIALSTERLVLLDDRQVRPWIYLPAPQIAFWLYPDNAPPSIWRDLFVTEFYKLTSEITAFASV